MLHRVEIEQTNDMTNEPATNRMRLYPRCGRPLERGPRAKWCSESCRVRMRQERRQARRRRRRPATSNTFLEIGEGAPSTPAARGTPSRPIP